MTDEYNVPVTIWIPQRTYARLHHASKAHDVTVAALGAELVRRALAVAAGPQQPVAPPLPPFLLSQATLDSIERDRMRAEDNAKRAARADLRATERASRAATKAAKEAELAEKRAQVLAKKHDRAARIARIPELHALRWSDAAIAREIGLSQPMVNQLRRHQFKLPSHYTFPVNRATLESPTTPR
jgi:hypothetical protein